MAEPGAKPVDGIAGHIEVRGVGEPFFHPDVWLTILNLETGESVDRSDGIGSASVDGGSHYAPCDGKPALEAGELRDLPVPPCHARWTAIVRWLDPKPGVEIPLELDADMLAHATALYPESDPFTLDALAITDAGVPFPVDGPAVTRGSAHGSTTLTSTSGREAHRYLLRVPEALLDGGSDALHLGRIFVGIGLKERSQPMSMHTELSIDDEVVATAGAPVSMERDWLARCRSRVRLRSPDHRDVRTQVVFGDRDHVARRCRRLRLDRRGAVRGFRRGRDDPSGARASRPVNDPLRRVVGPGNRSTRADERPGSRI